jgi:hypothetical protein
MMTLKTPVIKRPECLTLRVWTHYIMEVETWQTLWFNQHKTFKESASYA